jgi:hypothetical protein
MQRDRVEHAPTGRGLMHFFAWALRGASGEGALGSRPFCSVVRSAHQPHRIMNKKTNGKMPLIYNDPLTAVFLRILAWEQSFGNRKEMLVGKDLADDFLQTARKELGIQPNAKGGGAQIDYVKRLERQDFLRGIKLNEKEWGLKSVWRLQSLPNHRFVRKLSHDPHVEQIIPDPAQTNGKSEVFQFLVSLRAPDAPKLRVTIGNGRPDLNQLQAKRGLYFLRGKASLYVGQTEEFDVRWTQHTKNNGEGEIKWWVFVAPEELQEAFTLDSLNGAEALLISYWSEICHTNNKQRGKDKKPAPAFLQQSILLVEAASAALIWLMREKKFKFDLWKLPFNKCPVRHWPECYLNPFNNSSEAD